MFNSSNGYSLADLATAVGGNDNAFGGNGAWWLIVLIILFGGWGYGGFGNGAGAATLSGMATRADINEGFALDNITSGIRGIQNGICDSTYALNNTITSGFSNAQLQSANNLSAVQAGLADLGFSLQNTACQTNQNINNGFNTLNYNVASGFSDIKTQLASSTRDIVDNANANTRSIIDYLVQTEMSNKDARIAALSAELSQTKQTCLLNDTINAQTQLLTREINPVPYPSYIVNPPCQTVCSCCQQ